ncbi:hypothetical protein ACVXZ0_07810 [Staphylococcus aureus]
MNSNDYTAMRLHNLYETRLKLDELPLPTNTKRYNLRASIIQILNESRIFTNQIAIWFIENA